MKPDEVNSTTTNTQAASQHAAAQLLRTQINNLYDSPDPVPDTVSQTVSSELEDINPYDRTHEKHPQPQMDGWKKYHSAWQTYYQKYYEDHTSRRTKEDQPNETSSNKNETMYDLRQKLLIKVQDSAKKTRKRQHHRLVLLVMLVVAMIFIVLQYRHILIPIA